jgi:hypothetical protein
VEQAACWQLGGRGRVTQEQKDGESSHGCESEGRIRPCGRRLAHPVGLCSRSSQTESRQQNESRMTRRARHSRADHHDEDISGWWRTERSVSVTCLRGAGETRARNAGASHEEGRGRPSVVLARLSLGSGRACSATVWLCVDDSWQTGRLAGRLCTRAEIFGPLPWSCAAIHAGSIRVLR